MKRKIIGSLLAGLLLGLAGCVTNPETGRKQTILLSVQEEARMGVSAFQQIKGEETVSNNVMANDRVRRVGRRITAAVGREIPHAQWEFVVFESDELNAFALPGGKVGVYTGILDLAESDDELAAVIGHEIAHVTSRHSAERVTQQMAASGLALGAEVYMESQDMDSGTRALGRTAVAGATAVGYMLPYSRLHESEADAIGLKYAAGAGYDPRAAITFWQKMAQASEGQSRPVEFLSTHPSSETRIQNLAELAPQFLGLYEASKQQIDEAELDPVADREIGAPRN